MNIKEIIQKMAERTKTYVDNKVSAVKATPFDWNATDTTSKSYIKNKPTSLPANGGNVDSFNGYKIWTGTKEEYEAISSKESDRLYFILGAEDNSNPGETPANGDLVILKNKAMLNKDIHGGIYYDIGSYFDHISSKGIYTTNTVGVNDYREFTFNNKIDFSKYKSIKITYYDSLGNDISVRLFTSSTQFNCYTDSPKPHSGYSSFARGSYSSESNPVVTEIDISSWTGSHYFAIETYGGSNTYITELVLSESPVGSGSSKGLKLINNRYYENQDVHGGIYNEKSGSGARYSPAYFICNSDHYSYFTFNNKFDLAPYETVKITLFLEGATFNTRAEIAAFVTNLKQNSYSPTLSYFTVRNYHYADLSSADTTVEINIADFANYDGYFGLSMYIDSNDNAANVQIRSVELIPKNSSGGSGGETNNDLILFGNGQWQNTDISGGFTTNASYVYVSSNNLYFKNVRDLGLCTCSQSKIDFSKYKKLSFTVRADTTCTFYVGSYNQSYTSSQSSTFDPKTYNNRQKYNIDSSFTTYEIDISAWTTGYLMFLKTAQSLGPGVYISEIKLIGDSNGTGDKILLSNTVNTLGSFRVVYEHALDNGTGPMYHGAAFMEGSNLVTRFGIGNNSSGTFEGYECSLATQNAINVSGYTKLQFTIVDGDYATTTEKAYLQVGLGSNPSAVNYYPTVFKTLTGKPETNIGTYTVDISSFTSSNSTAYLVFYFNYGSTRGAANNNRYWFSEIKLIK